MISGVLPYVRRRMRAARVSRVTSRYARASSIRGRRIRRRPLLLGAGFFDHSRHVGQQRRRLHGPQIAGSAGATVISWFGHVRAFAKLVARGLRAIASSF
jgi:hypothetical protein